MDYLLVIDNATGEGCVMTLAQASALTRIAADDLEESIRTLGVCRSMDFIVMDTEAADDVVVA